MNDLDKSGFGYQQTKVWLGPSLGWTMEHVQPAVTIIDPGTYVVKPGDSLILVDCAGLVTIQLPDVRLWVQQPGYQPATAFKRSICVKDIGGNAGNFDIVVVPFGTQRIDDIQQSMLISTAFALVNLVPLIDLTGWTVQSNVGGGGGGGGGDVFKAGNNTFTGVNTFLNTITVPTMPAADSSTNAASTAFVKSQGYLTTVDLTPYAPLSSPTFTGIPRAPTPAPNDSSTQIATTAYVQTELLDYQPLDADLTALSAVTGSNDIYYRSGTSIWSPVVIGANLTFTGGVLSASGGGGGAPTDAEYITSSVHAGLSAERVLTNTASITWDFSTPGQAKASTAAGGGNVSNSGTPTAGQYGKWVTATTIQGVAPATVLSDIGAQPAGSYQPLDADLTAIAALAGTNTIYYRSAADTWSAVTVSTGLSFSGGVLTCTVSTAGFQPLDATLTALAAFNTNGLLTQTAADTFTGRTLTGPAAGITVTNGNGVAGNPTLALANDLAALEGLAGTNNIYYRSGADTWTSVTISAPLTFSGGALAIDLSAYLTSAAAAAAYQPLDGDLTAIAALTGTNTIYYRSATNTWSPVVIGANLAFSGGTLSASGGGGGLTLTTSATAPATPNPGDMWYDLSTGILALWINDGTSSQWVQIAPPTPVGIPGNFLPRDTTATIATGYTVQPGNLGTISSGTFTPSAANGNYQYYTNNGAHTFAAPTTDSAIDILVTNGASAGAITFSGYTVGANTGDALTTTVNHKFIISIRRINAISTYSIRALQ